ncbi:carbon-nitrogen hydrolase [Rubritalea tangerina]|uniref:Carbon-nitrogen hydrolase n=1 Tax=Rubritalea tangerina TaxID=430798 RepID=A0ABW4ZDL4_9BACT
MPNIALLQLTAHTEPKKNIAKTEAAIREAASMGAQIICTQELFTSEYFCTTQDTEHFNLAHPLPGPLTQQHQQLAKELGVVIVASGFEKRATGLYHNSAWVVDADGSYLGHYRKMHIPQDPGFEEKFYFTPGDLGYKAFATRFGKIGVLICWDQWYPEAARLTALKGAEVLIYPTAIGWLPEEKAELGEAQHNAWQAVQCGHAVANSCYIVAINRTGTEGNTEFWGQSFVANHYGQVIAKAPTHEECILTAELDLPALEEHRRIWPFFRDRRIDSYQNLSKRFDD